MVCFRAGYAAQAGTVLLDLAKTSAVTPHGDGTADVEAGAKLGQLCYAIWRSGRRVIPAGTCPTVGVGGHLLGEHWAPDRRICSLCFWNSGFRYDHGRDRYFYSQPLS